MKKDDKGGKKMNQGQRNEFNIANSYHDKTFSNLNDFQKGIIRSMYPNIDEASCIQCFVSTNKIGKPDIYFVVNGEYKFWSIKSGITDSVHFESIKSFILFLRSLGVSVKTQKILLLFHYGDGTLDGTGNQRMLYDELVLKNRDNINYANKELAKYEIVEAALNRFVFCGTENNANEVDYIYYGDEKYGVLCSRDELTNFVLSKNYSHYKTMHIGPMSIQPYLRDPNRVSRHPYKRDIVQIKWHYLLTDLEIATTKSQYYKWKNSQFKKSK